MDELSQGKSEGESRRLSRRAVLDQASKPEIPPVPAFRLSRAGARSAVKPTNFNDRPAPCIIPTDTPSLLVLNWSRRFTDNTNLDFSFSRTRAARKLNKTLHRPPSASSASHPRRISISHTYPSLLPTHLLLTCFKNLLPTLPSTPLRNPLALRLAIASLLASLTPQLLSLHSLPILSPAIQLDTIPHSLPPIAHAPS